VAVPVIYLSNDDFKDGTYQITKSGKYVLSEDIIFNPNPPTTVGSISYCCRPEPSQFVSAGGIYDDDAFGLGFFAAITISTKNVELDLNGHTIEQSKGHALIQRFFAVIELADQPFVHGQGPHDFGQGIVPASNVLIHNGVIGRSSHHGIHGNGNKNIQIFNIRFIDHEVAAVHLNGVSSLEIRNCYARNRKDVPVYGIFSSAIFIRPFLAYLVNSGSTTTLKVQQVDLTAEQVLDSLDAAIENVYYDVIAYGQIDEATHPEEFGLFHNAKGVIDGTSYGFVTNHHGVAVHGFPYNPCPLCSVPSRDVLYDNITVEDHFTYVREIIAIGEYGAVTDPVGSVLQIKNTHSKNPNLYLTVSSGDDSVAEYIGNVVSNAQIIVAKAKLNGDFADSSFDFVRNKINEIVIDWVEAGGSGSDEATVETLLETPKYYCNGDSMFHVNKGGVTFRTDATENVKISNCKVINTQVIGDKGSDLCGDYIKSHPQATLDGYGGTTARAFSFAGSSNIQVENCMVDGIFSYNGDVLAYDAFTDSHGILFNNCQVKDAHSGFGDVIGFHFGAEASRCTVKNCCEGNNYSDLGDYYSILGEQPGKEDKMETLTSCI